MLIPCSECGRDVSTKTKTCPHCGAPVEQANQITITYPNPQSTQSTERTKRKRLEIGAVLLLIFLVAAFSFRIPTKVPKTPESANAKTVFNPEPKARYTTGAIPKPKEEQSGLRPESTPESQTPVLGTESSSKEDIPFTAKSKSESAPLQQSASTNLADAQRILDLAQQGMMRVERDIGGMPTRFYVDPSIWMAFTAKQKQDLIGNVLSAQSAIYHRRYVVILDGYSGRQLGGTGFFGGPSLD